jgi:hypothetical protein
MLTLSASAARVIICAEHHALRRHDQTHEDQAGLAQAGPAQSSGVNTGLNQRSLN